MFFFPVVCFSNSIVSSMDTGAITVLIWVMPGTSSNAHSWSLFQAPPVALTAVSALPLYNQTGIRTKLLPSQHPSLNRMGISSCSFVFLKYLVHCTGQGCPSQLGWDLIPLRVSVIWPKGKGLYKQLNRASLVAQWLRICLPMQGTWVRALVWEDPTCRGATRPVTHNYWACASGACAPQQERLQQWEARAPRWRVAPACHN